MVIIPDALEPPPQIAPALLELGQHFLQRGPAQVTQWQQHGLHQALYLRRATEQFCRGLETEPLASQAQKQALRIICKRREKDFQRIAALWGTGGLEVEPPPGPYQTFEQLLYEYRWHQRAFQCVAWLLDLHGETKSAQVFQACADDLFFDLGFLQLAYVRSISRGRP